jgi:hypothetical protein
MEFLVKKIVAKEELDKGIQCPPPPPFVLIAELLQCNVKQGLFYLPIPSRDGVEFPITHYADGMILVMKASQIELLCLKALLESYEQSTGLRVNYVRSCLVPLNIFPCTILQSDTVGMAEVTENIISTSSHVPYSSTNSIGSLPYC